ncbi:MAG: site-specific integrase [Odoribacter sp.]|nr:site-specific integrase [Odoribacter sp.]
MDRHTPFSKVAECWLMAKSQLVKRSTYCAYSLIVKTHLLSTFKDHTQIHESEVQKFVIDKLNSGLKRKTVKDILATLKTIIRYGEKHLGFPGEKWEIALPTDTGSERLPTLSLSNHRKLLKYLLESPTTQNIGITIALTTGMRIGEVCALRWENIDLMHRVITVRHTVGRIYDSEQNKTERITSTPKTKTSNREIPISKELFDALRTIKSKTQAEFYVVGGMDSPKEPRTYREFFSRLLKRLGIPRIVFHGLRHTFATRCIECMCDYKTVSVILGHSNVATTMNLYVHPNYQQKKHCVDRLSKFINLEK